jgi:hypothetical protein
MLLSYANAIPDRLVRLPGHYAVDVEATERVSLRSGSTGAQ